MNIVHTNQEWIVLAKKAFQLQRQRKEIEKQEKALLARLKEKSGGVTTQGGGFVFEAILRKGSIDYASIPVLKEIDLEVYRKESVTMWKLYKI